jgi:hypothetical protein
MAEVRYPLPWNWEGLDADALLISWRRLFEWISWFVSRYHLVGRVPACLWRHPELADELRALWYYYQEVTAPVVELFQPDPVGDPDEPQIPDVPARAYREWHETRWRWTTGELPSTSKAISVVSWRAGACAWWRNGLGPSCLHHRSVRIRRTQARTRRRMSISERVTRAD